MGAVRAVDARARGALVDIHCAIGAGVAGHTCTGEIVHYVGARRTILTRSGSTLVDVNGAVLAGRTGLIASYARTVVRSDSVCAQAPVLARRGNAVVDVDGA